ncbi:MAG TPA: hypothetical protein ENI77_11105 [Nitrospirae bacterium]|nr:hypothetical protein [Nitrospirota bacterium]
MTPFVEAMCPSDVTSTPPIPHEKLKCTNGEIIYSDFKNVRDIQYIPEFVIVNRNNGVATIHPAKPFLNSELIEHEIIEEPEGLMELFQELKITWKNDTAHLSSPFDIAMHESYQRIMGMGEKALPLIFEEMTKEPDYWFWALRHITGENPTRIEHRGNMPLMTEDWLSWARSHSYL